MSDVLSINIGIIILLNALILWTGLQVLFSNLKEKANIWFFLMTIFSSVWLLGAFFGGMYIQDNKLATMLVRINWVGLYLFMVSTYFFSIYFPIKSILNKVFSYFIILFWVIISFFTIFTDSIIKDMNIGALEDWGALIVYGEWIDILYIFLLLFAIIIF